MLVYYYLPNTTPDIQCENNEPIYFCAGLMVSGFEGKSWYEPYMQGKMEKVSFSYWTPRIRKYEFSQSPHAEYNPQGVVFWPNEALSDNGTAMMPEYTCAYNIDAGTGFELGSGCGGQTQAPFPKCQDLGIYSIDQYIAKFGKNISMDKCGNALEGSPAEDNIAFETTLQEEEYRNKHDDFLEYDEIVMKSWAADAAEKVPLMSFFCDRTEYYESPSERCSAAMAQQANYYKKTEIFAPVIRVTGPDWPHAKFTYLPSDQSPDIPEMVSVFGGLKNPPKLKSSVHR